MATYNPPAYSGASASRRQSKCSENQRAMRVVKPSSASSSPQSSWNSSRRRTMMNDVTNSWRAQQVFEQLLASEASSRSAPGVNRPMSWHPDSFPQAGAHLYPDAYQQLPYHQYPQQWEKPSPPSLQQSPIMASTATSPLSAISPLPLGHNGHYLSPGAWQALQSTTPYYASPVDQPVYTEPFPVMNGMNWSGYTLPINAPTTTPPTPDAVYPTNAGVPAVVQESPQFQTLEEPEEDDGEVLVGMGLYDAPDKTDDSQITNYRSMVSSLLGSQFRAKETEGRGLKLEETWAPPPSSDEEEEDSDNEHDAQ